MRGLLLRATAQPWRDKWPRRRTIILCDDLRFLVGLAPIRQSYFCKLAICLLLIGATTENCVSGVVETQTLQNLTSSRTLQQSSARDLILISLIFLRTVGRPEPHWQPLQVPSCGTGQSYL